MKTKVALAEFDNGDVCVVHHVCAERNVLPDDQTDYDPFEKFVNATTLVDVLLCAERFGALFPSMMATYGDKKTIFSNATPTKPSSAKVQRLFFPRATRTEADRIRKCIDNWGFDESRFSKPMELKSQDEGASLCGHLFYFELLSDWLLAAKDLRIACTLLASYVGEASDADVESCFDSNGDIEQLLGEGKSPLQEFYANLRSFPSNENDSAILTQYDYVKYAREISDCVIPAYAMSAFNIMLSGRTQKLLIEQDATAVSMKTDCVWPLHLIWAHFADLFVQGKVSVCPCCGKVFTKKRVTKKYCSDSCKQSAYEKAKTNTAC